MPFTVSFQVGSGSDNGTFGLLSEGCRSIVVPLSHCATSVNYVTLILRLPCELCIQENSKLRGWLALFHTSFQQRYLSAPWAHCLAMCRDAACARVCVCVVHSAWAQRSGRSWVPGIAVRLNESSLILAGAGEDARGRA